MWGKVIFENVNKLVLIDALYTADIVVEWYTILYSMQDIFLQMEM